MGHEKTGEELEALCSEHPEQVEQLTKENLEILISWLIESQNTGATTAFQTMSNAARTIS